MPYVLTNAAPDAPAREFLTDRKRFPLEGAATTDLTKAQVWADRAGAFRFQSRHPGLVGFRRVPIDAGILATAQAADVANGHRPARTAQPGKARRKARPTGRAKGKARSKRRAKATQLNKGQRRAGKAHLRHATTRGIPKPGRTRKNAAAKLAAA